MVIPFTKMHGCGNDFVVVDARGFGADVLTPALAAAIGDRRTGVGFDQLLVIEPPPAGSHALAYMRIRNPDGGEAGACGNGTRCVADVLASETGVRELTIATVAGDLAATMLADGTVRVDMGIPRFGWADVPLARAMDTLHLPLERDPAACSMGNPHATVFVPDFEFDVAAIGRAMEHDPLFSDRANIGFARIDAPDRMRLRVWERTAGLTLACGSGTCAAVVNAVRRGLCDRRVRVTVDGGVLDIGYGEDGRVTMAGPVATSFSGTLDLSRFAA